MVDTPFLKVGILFTCHGGSLDDLVGYTTECTYNNGTRLYPDLPGFS